MKLVVYMYKKFFAIFFASLFFFVLVLGLTDLLMNVWNYISRNVAPRTVLEIMLYYVPKSTWYAVPIAMLFATAYMLSDLYAKNELLAVFACGISLFRFTAPLLLVSVLMSFGLFFFEDNLVVWTYAKKTEIQDAALHREQSGNNDRIVVMADEGRLVYKADYYDDEVKRLYGVYVLFRAEDSGFDALLVCDSALWVDGRWEPAAPRCYRREGEQVLLEDVRDEYLRRLVEPPETFRNNTVSVEAVSTAEARAYITHLEKAGLPSAEAKSEYYKKYAFPFVVSIVVFLAVGLSGKTRKNVLLISLALSITAVVLFYVLQMITMLMAKFEAIPPVFGAWFPVWLFVVVSALLLRYART